MPPDPIADAPGRGGSPMSSHQLGSANGSATLWRGRRWLLLRRRAATVPGFSAPSGRKTTTLPTPPGLGIRTGSARIHRPQLPSSPTPPATWGIVVKRQRRLGRLARDHPHACWSPPDHADPGLREVMPICRDERNPAAIAACVGDQVAQRPSRPTWPSATRHRWTSRRTRRAPNWVRASSARAVPWPRRRQVTYKQVTEVVDLHAKDLTGPSSGGQK
jgi:hypothetical protein